MADDQAQSKEKHKDFFISYTGKDQKWAEWIAWHLEKAGYSIVLQAWDFHAGGNFVIEMDTAIRQAERTIAVLSPDYFSSRFTAAEWAAAFRRDPTGEQGRLLPIRVRPCEVEGLFGQITSIDLVDQSEQEAQTTLLAEVQRQRRKPVPAPLFPSVPRPDRFPGTLPPIWNVPYPRNFYFTGREDLLQQLATSLRRGQTSAVSQPHAMSGLGGIGKTQMALEYAYRYYQDYQAVLWAQADTHENLTSSYLVIAALLNLPEKDKQESDRVIAAVKVWLQMHKGWLLILDNADDLAIVHDFLPPSVGGHVLLTTRAQATGRFAHRLEVDILPIELGALFLLRRAGLIAPDATLEQARNDERDQARAICQELGGLPLALDQAGAYIEETGCPLSEYREIFAHAHADLLQRRGNPTSEHPLSVTATLSLSLKKVGRTNPAALDLLQLLSFFHPDAIPLEILTKGAAFLGPLQPVLSDTSKKNEAIGELLKYSLVHRNRIEDTLSLHRLTQLILQEEMKENKQRRFVRRVVEAVNHTTQSNDDAWKERGWLYLPQFQACAALIDRWEMISSDALAVVMRAGSSFQDQTSYAEAEVLFKQALEILYQDTPQPDFGMVVASLNNLGMIYLKEGKYVKAEPLLQGALALCRKTFGSNHIDTATYLNNLALLYHNQGKYEQAEPLYLRALTIYEQQLGAEHPNTAQSLNNLAILYSDQGKYEQAEPLCQRALAIREQQLGPDHPHTANSLNNLARLYKYQGKYAQAEPLYLRALAIDEKALGPEHPDLATDLNNLAELYRAQGKYEQAEPLYQRALAIDEKALGPEHPGLATNLNNLALLYHNQGKYAQAEPLYQRALSIDEQQLGPDHPHTANSLNNLASLYRAQGKYEQAEPLYQRALSIDEQQLGPDHPNTAVSIGNLAGIYEIQEEYTNAEPLYQRALAIDEKALGPDHPDTANSLNNLAGLYKTQGKYEQAEPLCQRALTIREQQLEPDHPDTAQSLNNLAELYQNQGKYELAEPLHQRALAIREQQLGPLHPDTAQSLNNLALLYRAQGKDAQAEPLYLRALAIREQQLGPLHPDTANSLNNLANLYWTQGKYEQAEPLYLRALSIREQQLGPLHPDTANSLNSLAALYYHQEKNEQAEPLVKRALSIYEHALGPQHPTTQTIRANYAGLLRTMGHDAEAAALDQP